MRPYNSLRINMKCRLSVDFHLIVVLLLDQLSRIVTEGTCTVNHLRLGPAHFLEKCTFTGKYVNVCNTKWDKNEATVACRGAGLCAPEVCHVEKFEFVLANSTVLTEEMRCAGDEENLDRCAPVRPSILHNCNDNGFRVICAKTVSDDDTTTPLPDPSHLAGIVIGTLVAIVVMAIILSFAFSWARKKCVGA